MDIICGKYEFSHHFQWTLWLVGHLDSQLRTLCVDVGIGMANYL